MQVLHCQTRARRPEQRWPGTAGEPQTRIADEGPEQKGFFGANDEEEPLSENYTLGSWETLPRRKPQHHPLPPGLATSQQRGAWSQSTGSQG